MTQNCASAYSTLASHFPSYNIKFEHVPYCRNLWKCVIPANISANLASAGTTLLFIPQIYPIGAPNNPCGSQDAMALRDWFLPKGPVALPMHVTLVVRGMDLGTVGNNYHYERPVSFVPNMVELSQAVARWSSERSLPYSQVQFETMPLAEQIKVMQSTRILID